MRKSRYVLLIILMLFLIGCSSATTTSTTTQTTTNTETTTVVPTTEEPTTTLAPTTTVEPTTIAPTTLPVTTTSFSNTEPITTTEPEVADIAFVNGVMNQEVIVDHYFDPLLNVYAESSFGKDITSLIRVIGHVDYGTTGEYQLTYNLDYNEDSYSETITVTVTEGIYIPLTGSRPTGFNGSVTMQSGSYLTGSTSLLQHPVNPGFLRANLLNEAIPSSGWWTSLLVANYGGGNGIYLNPLRTAFYNEGMEITNPLDGFVQYWNPEGYQTIAQFPIALKDSYLRSSDLNAGYVTEVIDYSDSHVKVAMKNTLGGEDELVVTLVQGSPYVFAETANKNALTYTMDTGVVIEYYELNGTQITSNDYSGDAIIVKMVQRHSGYITSPPANVIAAEYTDKYYLLNAPSNTSFRISNNVLSMSLGDGNFISIVAINDLSETMFYHGAVKK